MSSSGAARHREDGVEDMRKKELRLVITFHTTAEAIAMETVCRKEDIPGRLIPVPRQISAGCGLSWSMPPSWRENMMGIMGRQGLGYQTMGEYLI